MAQLRHDVSTTFGVQESGLDWMTQTLDTLEEYLTGVRILGECTPRMADELMSYGERFSAQWVAERLRREGIRAEAVDARSFLRTDDRFGDATVERKQTAAALQALAPKWEDTIPVITGFIGADSQGRTTTLSREEATTPLRWWPMG